MDAITKVQLIPHILEIILSHTDVQTLLRCEQASRYFNCLLRTGSSTQIWKTKLEREFPPACLPVLYGHENWRDLACTWHAWSTPWLPTDADVEHDDYWDEEDLQLGDYFDRRENGVTRDLVDVVGNWTYNTTIMLTYPDGTLIDQVRYLSSPRRGDSLITPILNAPAPNLLNFPKRQFAEYVRPTNMVIQYDKTTMRSIYSDINTGNTLCAFEAGDYPGMMRAQGSISTLFLCPNDLHGVTTPTHLVDTNSGALFPINPPDDEETLNDDDNLVVFNETLAAIARRIYPEIDPPHWTLTLHRISTQSVISQYTYPSDVQLINFCITRFHLLTIDQTNLETNSRKITVRNLKTLQSLYTLQIPDTDRLPTILTSNTAVLYGRSTGGTYILDPIRKQKIRMTVPVLEHVDVDEPADVCQMMGYAFVIREFEVDEQGRRKGGLGRDRVFWQWQGDWVDVQLRD